jgi:hypothetical protein
MVMARDAWFVVRDGEDLGPYTLAALKDRAARGFLSPDTLVRNADATAQVKARTVAGLFAAPVEQSKPAPKIKKKTLIIGISAGALVLLTCGGLGVVSLANKRADKKDENEQKTQHEQNGQPPTSAQVVIVEEPVTVIPDSPFQNPFRLSPDGTLILVNGVAVWDVKTGQRLESKSAFPTGDLSGASAWELRLVPNDDGRIEVWHVAEKRLVAVVGKADGKNRSFRTITPDGRFVASAVYQKHGVEIWDIQKGRTIPSGEYRPPTPAPDFRNVKAPPMADATYNQIRDGMISLEVWKLAGGKPYDRSDALHREGRMGTDWIFEVTEYYHSKDHPGARIVLVYRGKGSQPPLVKKSVVQ